MNNHKTRLSYSSVYDEVCINCGATDGRNDDRLNQPCPKPTTPPADVEGSQELLPCPEGEEAEGYNAAIYQQVYDDVIDHATRERLQKLESSPSRRHGSAEYTRDMTRYPEGGSKREICMRQSNDPWLLC